MRARVAALLAGVFIAFPAVGTSELPKVLRYAFPIAETGFDPVQVTDVYSRFVTHHVFDGLYHYDHLARPFKIKPNTAAAMPEVSTDFRVWTIKLRPGTYFQDDPAFKGQRRELIAQDYVYSFKRYFDPRWKSPNYPSLDEHKIVGMAAVRDEALTSKKPFDYDRPVKGCARLIGTRFSSSSRSRSHAFYIPSQPEIYSAQWARSCRGVRGSDHEQAGGNRPLRLAEWRRSSKIVLENPYRERFYDAEPEPG